MKKKETSRDSFRLLLMVGMFFFPFVLFAQQALKGRVIDAETRDGLVGVVVAEKGTQNGVITDIDGNFSLNVSNPNVVLTVSLLGYKTQEVNAKPDLTIALQEDSKILDEVIVVGYGVQKKSVVTGAISSVKSDDLGKATQTRIENVLKGQVSGVQIASGSGLPGADPKVRIRGIGTINNSDPLYIIDGMAVDGGIRDVNPTDIESVEVLKDAASAAVYGARAANGVILITTKSGRSGKTRVNYDVSWGFQSPWKKKSVLNAEEYMVIMNERSINGGGIAIYDADEVTAARNGQTPNTDWQDEIFYKNAPVVNHQLSVSGGNEKISYYLSLGYFDQDGIIGGNFGASNFNRWSIRSNNTYEILNAEKDRNFLNKLKIGSNVTYSRNKITGVPGGANSEFGSALGSAISLTPLMNVYASEEEAKQILAAHPYAVRDKDGRVFQTSPKGFQEIVNPVALLNRPDKRRDNSDKFIGTFWGELDLLPKMRFRSSYGFDLAFWGFDHYRFPNYLSDITQLEEEKASSAKSNMNRGFTWQVENTLTYNLDLADKHHFTFLLGQSARKGRTNFVEAQGTDLLVYDPSMAVINSGQDKNTERFAVGGTTMSTLASYFGRIDYNFDEKYLFQATMRRDGSDKFGPNNKWGTFPSFSFGWNVTNEQAIKSALPEWFDYMKLRASWGINGNERIEQFAYGAYLEGGQNYYFGETMISGMTPGRIPNPNLKWEESKQTDLGIDLRFLDNAVTFTVDYFHKKTDGMLKEVPLPDYVGKKPPIANVGKMENSGWEFDLGYQFNVKDFRLHVRANASYLKNKLIDLGVPQGEELFGGSAALGLDNFLVSRNNMVWPFFYGYKTDGIIQNQQEADEYNAKYGEKAVPGDVKFKDIDGNDKIDFEDRVQIGKGMPDWTYGLTINAEWKNFDFTAFFQGAIGNDIFDVSQRADIPGINRGKWILDRWTGPGTSNRLPRVTSNDANSNWRASDLYVKNGDYCRLKNIQLGYTLPQIFTRKAGVERLRIYVAAENLLTFTKYKDGFDPEIGANQDGDARYQGVDKGIYPQARTLSFGANVTF